MMPIIDLTKLTWIVLTVSGGNLQDRNYRVGVPSGWIVITSVDGCPVMPAALVIIQAYYHFKRTPDPVSPRSFVNKTIGTAN